MALTTGKNGRAHVLEVANRVAVQEINGTTLSTLSTTVNTHVASGNTAAHVVSNISGLQTALDNKQPIDGDLTSIAGLSGTSGLLKKTAANTWTLDTNTYLTSVDGSDIVWSTTSTVGEFDTSTTVPTGSTRLNYNGYFYPTYINLSGSSETTAAATRYFVGTGTDGFVRPKTLANVKTEIVTSAAVLSANGGGGFGYTTGSGGTVTQATSRTTGVTLSKYCGNITLFSTTTTAGQSTSFVVTNTLVAATDNVVVTHISGGNLGQYVFTPVPAAGSFTLHCYTPLAQTVAAAPVVRITILKGVTA